jgi:twitching motility protein PilT
MADKDNGVVVERRRAHRLPINVNFTYSIAGSSEDLSALYYAVTKNISCSGLLFENEKQIPIDTELKIILDMPGLSPKAFEVEGPVVRVEKLFPSGKFDIGVNFSVISEEQKEEIKMRIERMNIISLLGKINKKEISDLHLTVNSPPMIRSYGTIKPLDNELLSKEEIKQMLYTILTDEQKKHLEEERDLDFSLSLSPEARYRVSIYKQRGVTEAVFRNIMPDIKSREALGLPDVVENLCYLKEGIVVIAGTTGSGKTTTITTMIDIINNKRGGVLLALEKPIEFLHRNQKGIVKQREVGIDVPTFGAGLKAALRQDPDVIVVGEILDAETIETALQAAETGHLVITSLHATDSVQVFDRIISLFPPEQRQFIYSRLSHSLKAIITQSLLIHQSGVGRVLATETCIVNIAVRRIIASGNFTELPAVIQTGSQYKMHLMQASIEKLFEQGLINAETYDMYTKKAGREAI